MAYGPPTAAQPARTTDASGGGAITALRNAMATSQRTYVAAAPAQAPIAATYDAYAAAPSPVRYDAGYRLDAGDKLRVVVYGQEGLTNTYAIDASGTGRYVVPLGTALGPGDTVQVNERWF